MKKIENEINKLTKELEQLLEEYTNVNQTFGIIENYDFEEEEVILSLTEYKLIENIEFDKNGVIELLPFEEPEINSINYTIRDNNKSWYDYTLTLKELIEKNFDILENSVSILIELLNEEEKKLYIEKLNAIRIKKIEQKQYITVKEFTLRYGKSSEWQKQRRARIKDKLPYIQEKSKRSILYKVEALQIWFLNNETNLCD